MSEDTQMISEVVVTALGIKREKKMLGYAVQEIKGDQLNQTGDPSVTSALQGKVAGLQMNTAGTGLGGSTKITIRGNSSLADNNQPLWIVDGVPFSDNNNSDHIWHNIETEDSCFHPESQCGPVRNDLAFQEFRLPGSK